MIGGNPIESNLKHVQLKKCLQKAIVNGDLKTGERLPSQENIADEYKVSLGTVREAITSLVNEGLLHRMQGKGTFVAELKKKPITLALVIPRLYGDALPGYGAGTEITPLLTQAVESAARKTGANILLYLYHDDTEIEHENLINVYDLCVDGMIIIHMGGMKNLDLVEQIKKSGTQVLFIDTRIPDGNFDFIVSNNEKGARDAINILIDNGYSNIIHITRKRNVSSLIERLNGYNTAMKNAKLTPKTLYIEEDETESTVENASYLIANDLLKTYKKPIAIYTSDAPLMAGVLRAIESKEIQANDLGLACFDETNMKIPNGILFVNIIQNLHEIGIKGVEIIKKRIDGENGDLSLMIDTCIKITDKRC